MEDREYQEKMNVVRQTIDEIDRQLLPLFLRRMECSKEVARLKSQAGQPVFAPQREQAILERVGSQGGEFSREAQALYGTILEVSRARQHQMLQTGESLRRLEREASRQVPCAPAEVICQGVEGAWSHQAAKTLFPQAPISFVPEFRQVFDQVDQGQGRLGVVPVENSAAGSVAAVYDLILQYRFYMVGAVDVKVVHCLAAADPAVPVTQVASHPQALSQCSQYLREKGLKPVEWSNTAAAARHVAQERPAGLGVLCSRAAAEQYGLAVLEEGVQNEKNNTTRFVVISREPILPEDANKISLCFSIPHTTGSLYHVLERFALCGLNLTKIESRPIPGRTFEYDFYLDFTGNIHQGSALDVLCSLQEELPRFSFLGNYSER